MKKNNIKKGFTLVELLVVIAILAILAVVSVVGYTSFTKKAKISNDIGLTTQLNTILQANETTDGANKYPHEAALELVDGGYDVTKITPTTEKYNYVYDLSQNRMFLLDESYNVVAPSDLTLSDDKVSVFGFAGSQVDVTEFNKHGFSVYLKSTYTSDSVTTSKGVDVGEKRITSLNYTNTIDGAQQVMIRTISASTNLNVNAPSDTIKHYGTAGSITLTKVSTSSFWEYGKAAFVELTEGRIVLTEESDVEIINVTKNESGIYNNPIIADGGVKSENLPSMISRDALDQSQTSQTPLVQIQKLDASGKVTGITEQVYATSGSTAKDESTGNTSISSVLGNLAVDTKVGDKSLTEEKKTEEKTNAVIQAESSESPKVEPVSNGIVYNSKSNKYYTETDPTKYETVLKTAISEASAGDTLYLLTDINTTSVIAIEKSIILDGQGHTITDNSSEERVSDFTSDKGRIIRVSKIHSGVVTLRNLKLVADKVQYTGVIVRDIDGNFTLNMNDVTIDVNNSSAAKSNGGYSIMIRGTAKNFKVNLNNVVTKGWGAIQSTSSGVTLTANDCTFNTINTLTNAENQTYNNYTAITVSNYYGTSESGSSGNNDFTFNNCSFTATYTNSAKQGIANIRSPYDNILKFNGCKFTYIVQYCIKVCTKIDPNGSYGNKANYDSNYDNHSRVYIDGKDVTDTADYIMLYHDDND